MNITKILSVEEVGQVLRDLAKRSRRSLNSRQNRIVFRLSCCCGLRVKEIQGLNLGDINLGSRPSIRIRRATTKGQEKKRKAREVPLWWDAGTLEDLRAWVEFRRSEGAKPDDPVVCGRQGRIGERLCRAAIANRWRTAIRSLGEARQKQLSIHAGRHSFCSHALFAGRSPVEVQAAAGHSTLSSTSIYAHVLSRDNVRDVFAFEE